MLTEQEGSEWKGVEQHVTEGKLAGWNLAELTCAERQGQAERQEAEGESAGWRRSRRQKMNERQRGNVGSMCVNRSLRMWLSSLAEA